MNIDHVTITINMVDPEIGAKIYPSIITTNAIPASKPRQSCMSARCSASKC